MQVHPPIFHMLLILNTIFVDQLGSNHHGEIISKGGEKMSKKIFLIIVSVLAFSLMLTPLAIATPGQKITDKHQTFILYMEGPIPIEVTEETKTWVSGEKVLHNRAADWVASYLELTLGSEVIGNDYLSYECELSNNYLIDVRVSIIVRETVYIWNDEAKEDLRGSITLVTKDNFFLTDPSSGTFSGKGMVDGQKVNAVGISTGEIISSERHLTRSGTIIGLQ